MSCWGQQASGPPEHLLTGSQLDQLGSLWLVTCMSTCWRSKSQMLQRRKVLPLKQHRAGHKFSKGLFDAKESRTYLDNLFARLGYKKNYLSVGWENARCHSLCCSTSSIISNQFSFSLPPFRIFSGFFSHYFQSLQFYLAEGSRNEQVHTILSSMTVWVTF